MPMQSYIPGLANYRGFAVAAISENIKIADYANWAIGYLPEIINYDQYAGVYGIATSSHADKDKQSQIYKMFHP